MARDNHFPTLPATPPGPEPDADTPSVVPISAGSVLTPDQLAAVIRIVATPADIGNLPGEMPQSLSREVATAVAVAMNLPHGPRPNRLGRPPAPARLVARSRGEGRSAEDPMVYLHDRDGRRSTGLRTSQERQAQAALALHKMIADAKLLGLVMPTQVSVDIVIGHWLAMRRPNGDTDQPQIKSYTAERHFARPLLDYFGGKRLVDITPQAQDAYVAWRMSQPGRGRSPDGKAVLASDQTARNETDFLTKALNLWKRESGTNWIPVIKKPRRNPPRVAWLHRGEAARALLGARGWLWDVERDCWKTRKVWDPQGREWRFDEENRRWRLRRLGYGAWVERPLVKRDRHGKVCRKNGVGRAMIIGFYTGTRALPLRLLRWKRNGVHGYFDFESNTLFRSDVGWPKTSKKQGACKMPQRLRQHALRWQKRDLADGIKYVVHHVLGRQYSRQIDYPIRWATGNAGMHPMPAHPDDLRFVDKKGKLIDVTLHVYRHTCATMMLEMGVSPEAVGNFLDITLAVLFATYGHRTTGGTHDPAEALDRSRLPEYRGRFS